MAEKTKLEKLREIVEFDQERAGVLGCVPRAHKVMRELRDRINRLNSLVAGSDELAEYWRGALEGTANDTPIPQAAVDSLYTQGCQWIEGVEAIQAVRPMFDGMAMPTAEPDPPPADVPVPELLP